MFAQPSKPTVTVNAGALEQCFEKFTKVLQKIREQEYATVSEGSARFAGLKAFLNALVKELRAGMQDYFQVEEVPFEFNAALVLSKKMEEIISTICAAEDNLPISAVNALHLACEAAENELRCLRDAYMESLAVFPAIKKVSLKKIIADYESYKHTDRQDLLYILCKRFQASSESQDDADEQFKAELMLGKKYALFLFAYCYFNQQRDAWEQDYFYQLLFGRGLKVADILHQRNIEAVKHNRERFAGELHCPVEIWGEIFLRNDLADYKHLLQSCTLFGSVVRSQGFQGAVRRLLCRDYSQKPMIRNLKLSAKKILLLNDNTIAIGTAESIQIAKIVATKNGYAITPIKSLDHPGLILAKVSDSVLACSDKSSIRIVNWENGEYLQNLLLTGHLQHAMVSLVAAPNNKLVAQSKDGTLYFFDTESDVCTHIIKSEDNAEALGLQLSEAGKVISAVCCDDDSAVLIEVFDDQATSLKKLELPVKCTVGAFDVIHVQPNAAHCLLSDNRLLTMSQEFSTSPCCVKIWDLNNPADPKSLQSHRFEQDGAQLPDCITALSNNHLFSLQIINSEATFTTWDLTTKAITTCVVLLTKRLQANDTCELIPLKNGDVLVHLGESQTLAFAFKNTKKPLVLNKEEESEAKRSYRLG